MQKLNNQASLLIEALIVVVVLAVGLTFIIQSLSSSLRALNYSTRYSQAVFLIDNTMSQISLDKNISAGYKNDKRFEGFFKGFRSEVSSESPRWPGQDSNSDFTHQINLKLSWPNGKNTQDIQTALCLLKPDDHKDP